MSAYAGDVAALARKDLLLELRSRDTVPAMLLFVVSALTIFHFALPSGSSARAETGLLWIAIVFTALLIYEHAIVRPGDLKRLDTAFFLMNGVISVTFFGFVLLDSLF